MFDTRTVASPQTTHTNGSYKYIKHKTKHQSTHKILSIISSTPHKLITNRHLFIAPQIFALPQYKLWFIGGINNIFILIIDIIPIIPIIPNNIIVVMVMIRNWTMIPVYFIYKIYKKNGNLNKNTETI